jgi:hypothetical protein
MSQFYYQHEWTAVVLDSSAAPAGWVGCCQGQ